MSRQQVSIFEINLINMYALAKKLPTQPHLQYMHLIIYLSQTQVFAMKLFLFEIVSAIEKNDLNLYLSNMHTSQ